MTRSRLPPLRTVQSTFWILIPRPLPAPTAESSLATLIYQRCYVRPSGPDLRVLDQAADREFQLSLFHANGDAAVWESGWNLEPERTNGRVTVSRYGVRFTARPDEVRGTSDGAHARAPCLVRVPTKYQRLLPHFFLILGTAESTTTPALEKASYGCTGTCVATVRPIGSVNSPVPSTTHTCHSAPKFSQARTLIAALTLVCSTRRAVTSRALAA